ncbi:GldM family protein [Paraflavitalea pollutisoli]|uniref:GldM family protein n=1 Tax=Paraflavitalea pollutisoli TaxID=3034143 RepID=UPI0023EDCA4A|nr:GldM family protein [Paraflavitalea sp. H1-2-19X]
MQAEKDQVEKLLSFRQRDKFSASAWDERGLSPSNDALCRQLTLHLRTMKFRMLIVACLLANALTATAQDFTITSEVNNVIYKGMGNPLVVVANGVACDKLELQAKQCSFTRKGCSFTIRPDTAASSVIEIEVFDVSGSQRRKIGSLPFRCIKRSPPVAYVGNRRAGTITKQLITELGAVVAMLENPLVEVPLKITGFHFSLYRSGAATIELQNEGGRFGAGLTQLLTTLKAGDRIVLSNIIVQYVDTTRERIAPIEFEIVD